MKYKRKIFLNLVYLFIFASLNIIFYSLFSEKQESLIQEANQEEYKNMNSIIQKKISLLIRESQDEQLALSQQLSQDEEIISSFKQNNFTTIDLKNISSKYKKNLNKETWIHLIDKHGYSAKRSWTNETGDLLLGVRPEFVRLLGEPHSLVSVGVGRYNLSIKAITPVYNQQHTFLGFIEVISSFDDISKRIKNEGFEIAIISKKETYEQLSKSLGQTLANGYYIANQNANKWLINKINTNGIGCFNQINNNGYKILEKEQKIIFNYRVFNNYEKLVATIVIAKNVNDIVSQKVETIKTQIKLYMVGALLISAVFIYFIIFKDHYIIDIIEQKKLATTLLIIFSILSLAMIFIVSNLQNKKIQEYLQDESLNESKQYQNFISEYEVFSQIIFKTLINKDEIKSIFYKANDKKTKNQARDDLYNALKNNYMVLSQHNIRQLHFHLPNNESFLRFHEPNKFGDNLTNIRKAIMLVNRDKKYFNGFEEGRFFSGYRFIYPLFYNSRYIGSTEIALSPFSVIEHYSKQLNKKTIFLISKKVANEKTFELDKYTDGFLDSFYYDEQIAKKVKEKFPDFNPKIYDKKILNNANEKIFEGEVFSDYIPDKDSIITWIPVKNELTNQIVGVFVVSKNDFYIKEQKQNTIIISSASIAFFAIIFIFMYRNIASKITLAQMNKTLEQKVQEATDENARQIAILQQQNKLASMGEMLGAIAHQWRQPLSVISGSIQNLNYHFDDGLLQDKEFIKTFISENKKTIKFMSKTIDDFMNFFKQDKSKHHFSVKQAIDETMFLHRAQFSNLNIEVFIDDKDFEIYSYKSEFMQVILNLASNAKDVIIERNASNRKIIIEIFPISKEIHFHDFAGGIDNGILERIFEPYFTTKTNNKGFGIGLYMSKMIIEKNMGGLLNVMNENNGACFVINLKGLNNE